MQSPERHVTSFTVNETKKCDSLDDLKQIGGHTKEFVINIDGKDLEYPKYASYTVEIGTFHSSAYIHSPDGHPHDWSKYAQISAIFTKRKKHLPLRIIVLDYRIYVDCISLATLSTSVSYCLLDIHGKFVDSVIFCRRFHPV